MLNWLGTKSVKVLKGVDRKIRFKIVLRSNKVIKGQKVLGITLIYLKRGCLIKVIKYLKRLKKTDSLVFLIWFAGKFCRCVRAIIAIGIGSW